MTILYLFGLRIFQFLVFIASFFNSKAKLWLQGRKNLFKKLKKEINRGENIAWFHCASLGEFEQGRPVIEKFKEKYTDYKILLTFYSPSGYEIRKNYEKADFVYYLPLDTPGNAKRFLDIVNPQLIVFVKYEFWYFFIKEIGKRRIPLYLISGIFRKKQRFFKSYGVKSRKMLGCFNHFFVQNGDSELLLKQINFENVTVAGDTRFDRVYDIANKSKDLPLIEKFKSDGLLLIAGSSWKPDEEIIFKWYNENYTKLKLIVAPHEVHSENIQRILKLTSSDYHTLKYSEATIDNVQQANVLIIDSIGLLSSIYKYGDLAYIGGGFGKGIHNILEAATFGMPVFFGPNYKKFQEAIDLINFGGAFSISDYNQFKDAIEEMIENPQKLGALKIISADFIKNRTGATEKIISFLGK